MKSINSKVTVGVVIPCKNEYSSILATIASIKSQTYSVDQLIIVFDQSDDGSYEIVNSTVLENENIILIKSDVSLGVPGAIKVALGHIKTDYVAFISANDRVKKNLIQRFHETIIPNIGIWSAQQDLEKNGVLQHHFSTKPSKKTTYISSQECIENLTSIGSWFIGATTFYNAAKLKKQNLIHPELLGLYDLYISYVLSSRFGAVFVPESLAISTIHKGGYLEKSLKDHRFQDKIINSFNTLGTIQSPQLFTKKFIKLNKIRLLYAMYRARNKRIGAAFINLIRIREVIKIIYFRYKS